MKQNKITFIVYIHYRTWFRYTRRPHFSGLAKFGEVMVIENPMVLLSKEFLKSPLRTIKHYFQYSSGYRKDERNNITVYRPSLLFSENLKGKKNVFRLIDKLLLSFQIRKVNKIKGPRINFITSLGSKWLIDKRKGNRWILDINDDWSMMKYDKLKEKHILEEAKKLIGEIDLATAVTKKLTNKYNVDNKTVFLPNAVDTRHYVPSFEATTKRIKEENVVEMFGDISFLKKEEKDPRLYLTSLEPMNNKKKPIVGSYSGLSGNWSDFEFISNVEKLLPQEYTMISSGNIHPPTVPAYIEEYKKYMKNQRMIYLGYVDYSVLPEFLSKIDVGLVMHRMDEFNTHSAPNKIWAYLAMGLPVVSTDFLTKADKEIYEDLVCFCKTPEAYVEAIIHSYKNDNIDIRSRRRDLAVRYSTDNRAAALIKILSARFNLDYKVS